MFKAIFILIALPAIFLSQVFSQSSIEELKEEYHKEIKKLMKKKDIPGASIILLEGDSILWEAYFGYADASSEIPVDEHTLFKTGSVTKLFTGTGIMQLQERGKINLDEPVSKYLPSLSINQRFPESAPITSRLILSHQSGLPSDIMKGFVSDSVEVYTAELAYLNEEYTAYPAGVIRSYSNPGFNLLGILIGEVTGTSYMDYTAREILKPLEMNSSKFHQMRKSIDKLSADHNREGEVVQDGYLREIPAGGLVSNVQDMSEFLSLWLNNERNDVLSEDSKLEMLTFQPAAPFDLGETYPLAWMANQNTHAGTIYHHGGATFYHRAKVAIAPESNLGVVILTNAARGNAICKLYDEILTEAARVKGYEFETKETANSIYPDKKIKLTPDVLLKYSGAYAFPAEAYNVEVEKSHLVTNIQDTKVKLIPVAENSFIPRITIWGPLGFKIKKIRFVFHEVAGEQLLIQEEVENGNQNILGQRIENPKIPEVWKNRMGEYEVINQKESDYQMFTDFELRHEDGMLALKFKVNFDNNPTIKPALIPIDDKLAYIAGLGRQAGQSVRIMKTATGEEILYYSGYKLKKIN